MLHNYMIILTEYVLLTLRQLHICCLDFRQPQLTSSTPPRNPISSFPLPHRDPMSFPNSSRHSAHFSPPCPSRVLMTHWAHSAPPAGMFTDLCSSYSCSSFTGPRPKDSIPQAPPHSPALSSFHPSSDISEPWGGEWCRRLFRAKHLTVTYCQLFESLHLTAAYHKKRRLWPWLRTVPIHGQKHPEGSMVMCSLAKQQLQVLPWGHDLPSQGIYRTRFTGPGLYSKVAGSPHNCHATTPSGTSGLAGFSAGIS